MAPAPCWPTKATAPDSGNVLPILMVVSLKPCPFAVTFLGTTGAGAGAPGWPGAGAVPAADAAAGVPGSLPPFVPAGAAGAPGADPAFWADAADATPLTASSTVAAAPSGVVTGAVPGSAGAAAWSGAAVLSCRGSFNAAGFGLPAWLPQAAMMRTTSPKPILLIMTSPPSFSSLSSVLKTRHPT